MILHVSTYIAHHHNDIVCTKQETGQTYGIEWNDKKQYTFSHTNTPILSLSPPLSLSPSHTHTHNLSLSTINIAHRFILVWHDLFTSKSVKTLYNRRSNTKCMKSLTMVRGLDNKYKIFLMSRHTEIRCLQLKMLCLYRHTHTHTHMHTSAHVCIQTHTHTYKYTYIHAYVQTQKAKESKHITFWHFHLLFLSQIRVKSRYFLVYAHIHVKTYTLKNLMHGTKKPSTVTLLQRTYCTSKSFTNAYYCICLVTMWRQRNDTMPYFSVFYLLVQKLPLLFISAFRHISTRFSYDCNDAINLWHFAELSQI